MTRRWERVLWPATVVAALLLADCTAARFSSLQTEFDQLHEQSVACERATGSNSEFIACSGAVGTAMLELAREAQYSAELAQDPRTRIGPLRLACMAGWQSRLSDGLTLADKVALEGEKRCEALPPDEFGAPRDCAVLSILPGLVAHEATLVELERAEEGLITVEQTKRLLELARNYLANTWDFLEQRRAVLEANPDLDPRMIAYVKRQRIPILCTASPALSNKVEELGDSSLARELEAQRNKQVIDFEMGLFTC